MTTAIEVLDTAVKIGLGAIISGASTYLLSRRSFNESLLRSKIEAKANLLKEASLRYEEAIGHLNKCSHGSRKLGEENFRTSETKILAEHLIEARVAINHAESCARLAGLEKLADCYGNYSTHINDLNLLYTDPNPQYENAVAIYSTFGPLWQEIRSLLAESYDVIYSTGRRAAG